MPTNQVPRTINVMVVWFCMGLFTLYARARYNVSKGE